MILDSKIFLARFIDLEETRFHWKQKRNKKKWGDSRESYKYKSYMLLPFLLCFSLPLLFADSF